MTIIKKSAEIIGGVISLLMGEDVTTPMSKEMKDNPFWYIY